MNHDVSLVVLAAGLSNRFGRVKQLEPVGPSGEALVDYAIFDAIRSGFAKVVLVIRPELENAFRAHVERLLGSPAAVEFTLQELDSLPPGHTVPPDRCKPWGTGHAIPMAEDAVDGPFVVSNADDFYGASSYALLRDHLEGAEAHGNLTFALVGYRLVDTPLSATGGVSRAICECDDDGFLETIVEFKQITTERGRFVGVAPTGEPQSLSGSETASMNLWGFTPAIFPLLKRHFAEFLHETSAEPDAEFLISTAMNEIVAAKQARVRVIPAREPGFGMTYAADRDDVAAKISELVAGGSYPADLPQWFHNDAARD